MLSVSACIENMLTVEQNCCAITGGSHEAVRYSYKRHPVLDLLKKSPSLLPRLSILISSPWCVAHKTFSLDPLDKLYIYT